MESVPRATSFELCGLTFGAGCCLYLLLECLFQLPAICAYSVLLLCEADAMYLEVVFWFSGSKHWEKDMHIARESCWGAILFTLVDIVFCQIRFFVGFLLSSALSANSTVECLLWMRKAFVVSCMTRFNNHIVSCYWLPGVSGLQVQGLLVRQASRRSAEVNLKIESPSQDIHGLYTSPFSISNRAAFMFRWCWRAYHHHPYQYHHRSHHHHHQHHFCCNHHYSLIIATAATCIFTGTSIDELPKAARRDESCRWMYLHCCGGFCFRTIIKTRRRHPNKGHTLMWISCEFYIENKCVLMLFLGSASGPCFWTRFSVPQLWGDIVSGP